MKWLRIPLVALVIMGAPLAAQAQSSLNDQTSSQSGSQSGSLAGANASFYGGSSTYVNPQETPAPTAPAFVTASPCMGVMSGAGTSPVVGIALGMSYKDKECESRANASALNSLGDRAAAFQVMCQIDQVKSAMAAAGTPCDSVHQVKLEDEPAPVAAPAQSPIMAWCSKLDPENPDDQPYLETECNPNYVAPVIIHKVHEYHSEPVHHAGKTPCKGTA